jgi:hypothetical protein
MKTIAFGSLAKDMTLYWQLSNARVVQITGVEI